MSASSQLVTTERSAAWALRAWSDSSVPGRRKADINLLSETHWDFWKRLTKLFTLWYWTLLSSADCLCCSLEKCFLAVCFFTPLSFNLIEDRMTRDKRLFDSKPQSPSGTSSCSPHHTQSHRDLAPWLCVLSPERCSPLSLPVACYIQPVVE